MSDEIKPENNADITIKSSIVPDAPSYGDESSAVETVTNNKSVSTTNTPQPIYVPRVEKNIAPPPPAYKESAARQRARRRRGRSHGGEWAWVIIAVAMFSAVIMIGFSIFLILRSSSTAQEILPTSEVNLSALPTPANFRTENDGIPVDGEEITLDDGTNIILRPWDGESRLTVLVMGLDRRPGDTSLAHRTDTILLVSLDPQAQSLGILSIPRDLYVPIQGYNQRQRINTAVAIGEGREPGTGPTVAMQTVQYNFGIYVHAYVVADFNAVIELVDAIGGIDVTTDYTINDQRYPDMNYGFDPFYLPAGTHHLDGYDALRLARTRHGDNDFERARRQQEVIFAIRDRVLGVNMLPQLIVRAPSLISSWEDNVYTNLSLEQIIQLAWYLKDIPLENIQTGVVDYNYTTNYFTSLGEAVLIPSVERLSELLTNVFGANYSQ